MARLILDVSTIARWTGPPVGIVRVEHELARHARTTGQAELAFYDPRRDVLRELAPAWADIILGLQGAIDTIDLDFRRHRPGWKNLLSARYPLAMALERRRLAGSALAGRLQAPLLGADARRQPFGDRDGTRHAVVPLDLALGPPLTLGPADTVLTAGSDWLHKGRAMLDLRLRHGFGLVAMCYDLLPLLHPEWFRPAEIAPVADYWHGVLAAGVSVLCNAECVARDLIDYAARHDMPACRPIVVPLGYAPPAHAALPPLPAGLGPGRFALFVSTLEPRKGHAMLLDAWARLVAEGLPQRHDFRLVFVGRPGWMVDDVMRRLRDGAGQVLHLQGIDDATLARLYRDSAFCLYPSRSEGFGLPIIEAFAAGRAVIGSTGGAVPETIGRLSPCLDPLDVGAWAATLAEWIENPAARAPWEALIARDFRHPTWPEAAARIMAAAAAAR